MRYLRGGVLDAGGGGGAAAAAQSTQIPGKGEAAVLNDLACQPGKSVATN